MSYQQEINQSQNPVLKLMVVEDDPVFRLGLTTGLEQFIDLQVVVEANSKQTALRSLQELLTSPAPIDETPEPELRSLDVVILNLDLGLASGQKTGFALYQQIASSAPTLPVLLLSATPDPVELLLALQAGAKGYCPKGTAIDQWATAIRQVAAGQPSWAEGMQVITQALTQNQPSFSTRSTATETALTATDPQRLSPLAVLRQNLRASGLRQIEAAIANVNTQLNDPDLSPIDQLFLVGQRRELRAARWLVNRLLHRVAPAIASTPDPTVPPIQPLPDSQPPIPPQPPAPQSLNPRSNPPPLSPASPADARSLQAALFDAVSARVQSNLYNLTNSPLEIDILKEEKKRELLYIILRKLEEVLDDLRFSQVQVEQLVDKQALVLQDLWQATTMDFFGRYYTLQLNRASGGKLRQLEVELVDVLLQDAVIVQTAILNKIPLVSDFLAHLLFQTPLAIEDAVYPVGTVDAMFRMELILQNLIIQVANAVVQPLLNRFGDVVTIKQNFYDKRLLSSREIERFRNSLSWKYRVERYFDEPKAIFESRYNLLALRESGITKTSIYAPRNEELSQLSGIPFVVTIALEARDAISPQFRSAISFVGSGVVYVLTEVLGRGIGLIGRGVVKGIGNALQDTKWTR